MQDEMITISSEEYEELLDDALFLSCLRIAGVDNWQGFELAIDAYEKAQGGL